MAQYTEDNIHEWRLLDTAKQILCATNRTPVTLYTLPWFMVQPFQQPCNLHVAYMHPAGMGGGNMRRDWASCNTLVTRPTTHKEACVHFCANTLQGWLAASTSATRFSTNLTAQTTTQGEGQATGARQMHLTTLPQMHLTTLPHGCLWGAAKDVGFRHKACHT
jgi:hypothetical protein